MTAFGAYLGNSPERVNPFETYLGHPVDFVRAHSGRADWADWDGSIGWESGLWAGTGRAIYWSIPLFANSGDLKTAASGAYDSHYVQAAKTILAGQPNDATIVVRVGEEFNGTWMPWSADGKEADFIAAYRQFVDSFRSVSSKFRFEWNVNLGGSMDPAKAYPGDAYVDVVGMDFFYDSQWDSADPTVAWASKVNQAYGLQWHQDFATAHGKPTAYSEWGLNSDAPSYVTAAAQWFASHNVAYQSFWDVNDYGYLSEITQYAAAKGAFESAFGATVTAQKATVVEGSAALFTISLGMIAATDQTVAYTVDGGAIRTVLIKAGQSATAVSVGTTNDGVAGTIEGKATDSHVVALANQVSASVSVLDAGATGPTTPTTPTKPAPVATVTDAIATHAGTKAMIQISGSADAGTTVTLVANGAVVASGIASDGTGHWTKAVPLTHTKTMVFTATAKDALGQVSTVSNKLILGTSQGDTLADSGDRTVFVGAGGNDTLTGGPSGNDFVFHHGTGRDVINGFQTALGAGANHDRLVIGRSVTGLGSDAKDSDLLTWLLQHTADNGAGITISLTGTDTIQLPGLLKGQLGVADVHLV